MFLLEWFTRFCFVIWDFYRDSFREGVVYLVVFVEQVARADELKLPLQIVSDFLCLAIWSLSSRAHTEFLGALEPPISAKWLFQQVALRT